MAGMSTNTAAAANGRASHPDEPVTRQPHDPEPAQVRREEVSFTSAGLRCDGWLYRPVGPGPHPGLVMAHGMGGIRAAVLPNFAERFAQNGIAVLVFDYRHSGTSEGHPRGLIDIATQRADYHAAIRYVRGLEGIDPQRIGLWGTSFSGGHVLDVTAEDSRIAAAVIQNPHVDGRSGRAATMRSAGPIQIARLAWAGLRDQAHALLGRPPHRVRLVGPPGSLAMFTTPDALPGYRSILPAEPHDWEPAVPARIMLHARFDRPYRHAPRIHCPLLVCVCDRDRLSPPRPAVDVSDKAPHGELRRYPIEHFDLFTGPWFEQVISDQIAFLRRTLVQANPR